MHDFNKAVRRRFVVGSVFSIIGFALVLFLSLVFTDLITVPFFSITRNILGLKVITLTMVTVGYWLGWILARTYHENIDTFVAAMGPKERQMMMDLLKDTPDKRSNG